MSYRSSSYSRGSDTGAIVILVIIAIAIISLISWAVVDYQQQFQRTITVCSKESVAVEGGAEYRIYGADDTYVMKDTLIGGVRFNTANAYGKIKEGTTYDATLKGWRLPIISAFPNILEVKVAAEQHPELCDN